MPLVRYLGPANTMKAVGPSGSVYIFAKGEVKEIDTDDWVWCTSRRHDWGQVMVVEPPTPVAIDRAHRIKIPAPLIVPVEIDPPAEIVNMPAVEAKAQEA